MEQVYNIILVSFCLSQYFAYDNNLRIIILILTYPLLAWNCYYLSLEIHKFNKKDKIIQKSVQIILFSFVINYFQLNEILFDVDDSRRYIIITLSIILIFYNFFNYF